MPSGIFRPGAEALIPEEVTKEIVQGVVAQSAALSQFRKLPNMSSNRLSMPVLEMLPMAYWVTGDTGTKQTTEMSWEKKYIKAEEVAVIVPIPEAVLNDAASSGYDIWGEVRPRVEEAFGKVIDQAIIFGTNKPTEWRDDIVTTAASAGNSVAPTGDFFNDIFGEDGVIAKVELSGFVPNGVLSHVGMRGKLRGLVDLTNRPLFMQSLTGATSPYALDGMGMFFLQNGAWDTALAQLIIGDMSQAVYSIRQDITYKMLTEGVIQDPNTKEIVYNLAQNDMVALRVVMRLGWEIPNPINALMPDRASRSPFAIYGV